MAVSSDTAEHYSLTLGLSSIIPPSEKDHACKSEVGGRMKSIVGKDIIGTWRLIKTSARNDAGEPMHPPYGSKPRGLVVFYPDNRMMSVLCDGRSELPAGETVREYNSYCGNYDYDGENLVTRVDASASKDRVGGEQKRFVRFDGEHMVLTQKPRLWQGVMQHRELVWERVADAPAKIYLRAAMPR